MCVWRNVIMAVSRPAPCAPVGLAPERPFEAVYAKAPPENALAVPGWPFA